MASHEFRTPLAAILLSAETLSRYRDKLTDDKIYDLIERIHERGTQLNGIIENMLNLSRIEARQAVFNPTTLNLHSLCTGILDEFRSQSDTKHEIVYTCNDPDRQVTVDPQLMRQVITNLVSNAIKYSPEGKLVSVNIDYTNKTIILQVSDTGIGIPEADLKHLFEPFHRAKNVGAISGTGLGLVITKNLIELHGGTINVESQVGVGTTFTVNIPLNM
jgi:signal transduction histidine kinase